MKSTDIHVVAPLDSQPKFRLLDSASDVASLINELMMIGSEPAAELAEVFVKRYMTAAKDRDLPKILPLYQTLQAVRRGVELSERMLMVGPDDPQKDELQDKASRYYNIAVKVARQIEIPA